MKLIFTKYLDVKDPVKTSSLESGFDLFIPEFDNAFIKAFYKFNPHLEDGGVHNHEFKDNKLWITATHKFAIPSGITLDYPANIYGTIENRSSNWKRDILVQRDICDNSYTGDGHVTQCIKTNPNMVIVLRPGERISQLVLHNLVDIDEPQFITYEEFQKLVTVNNKRNHRDGGFGSSGK